MTSPFYNI